MLFTVSSVLFSTSVWKTLCRIESTFVNYPTSKIAAKHVYGEHSFHTFEPLSHACGSNDSSTLSRQMCVSVITAELTRAAWTLRSRCLGSLLSFAFKISNPTRNHQSNIPHFNNESPDVCCSTPWSIANLGGKECSEYWLLYSWDTSWEWDQSRFSERYSSDQTQSRLHSLQTIQW